MWESLISPRTVVYANAHAMGHDERIYHAPYDFNPERYEPLVNGGAGEPFPVGNFGFGRRYVDTTLGVLVAFLDSHKLPSWDRVCVGRFLADNSVWIMVATMLATLEFRKKMGPDGSPIEPRVRFTNGGTWSVNSPPTLPTNPFFYFKFWFSLEALLTTPMTTLLLPPPPTPPACRTCQVADNVCLSCSHPEHFECDIRPRSHNAAVLVGASHD